MPARSRIRVCLPWLAAGLFTLCSGRLLLHAQTASDRQVKAAYLYNFAKFVEWPEHTFASSTDAIHFCIWNDRGFEADVRQIVNGKLLAGRSIEVVGCQNIDQLRKCHILFIGSSDERETRRILQVLREVSALTVGDMKDFIANGGIINFVLQEDRVQFEVNHKSATRAGLRISSRLLGVAKLVVE